MQHIKKAKRIIENMKKQKGGDFKNMYGNNQPIFYNTVIKGGADEISETQIQDARQDITNAQNKLNDLLQAKSEFNKQLYQDAEEQCDKAIDNKQKAVAKIQEQESKNISQKCSKYNELKPKVSIKPDNKQVQETNTKKQNASVSEEAKPKNNKLQASEESVKSQPEMLKTNISPETQKSIQQALERLSQKNGTVESNKIPFNILYVDSNLGKTNGQQGVSVFSGGGSLYFMDSTTNKLYKQNTRSEKGKKIINNFLKKEKLKVSKQNGGNILTSDGRVYLSKERKNRFTGGNSDFTTTNLGHVYQTQGGSKHKKRTKKSNKKN